MRGLSATRQLLDNMVWQALAGDLFLLASLLLVDSQQHHRTSSKATFSSRSCRCHPRCHHHHDGAAGLLALHQTRN